jgi:hypothetical protein
MPSVHFRVQGPGNERAPTLIALWTVESRSNAEHGAIDVLESDTRPRVAMDMMAKELLEVRVARRRRAEGPAGAPGRR